MQPLRGVTVVSLEQAIAAPYASRHLADLGARVIKVERPGVGDFARSYDTRVDGMSSHFVWTNRNKESLTLDIKDPRGIAIARRLLADADVFVQNLAPGAAARAGLGAEELQADNPRLIVCDISGYGLSGPYESMKAYDLMVQSEAGLLSVTGSEEEMAKVGISVADIAAGMYAYSSILAALLERGRSGTGAHLDVSMFEATVEWMGFPLYYAYDGAEPPPRAGAAHATIYPYGPFVTRDDKVVMMGIQNEREWRAFCDRVPGRSRPRRPPRVRDQRRAQRQPRRARRDHRGAVRRTQRRRGDRRAGRDPGGARARELHAGGVGTPAAGRARALAPGPDTHRRCPVVGAARVRCGRAADGSGARRSGSTPAASSRSSGCRRTRSTRSRPTESSSHVGTGGLDLARRYYQEVVAPLLMADSPGLPHAGARLGSGSDVLGLDDEVSRDHDWGLRMTLLVDGPEVARVDEHLERELPASFAGLPTRFATTWDPVVRHRVEVDTPDGFAASRLGLTVRWAAGPAGLVVPDRSGAARSDRRARCTATHTEGSPASAGGSSGIPTTSGGTSWPWTGHGSARSFPSSVAPASVVTTWAHGSSPGGSCTPPCIWDFCSSVAGPRSRSGSARRSHSCRTPVPLPPTCGQQWRPRPGRPARLRFAAALVILHDLQRDVGLPTGPKVIQPFFERPFYVVSDTVVATLTDSITDPRVRQLAAGVGSIEQWVDNVTVLTTPRLRHVGH